MNSEYGLDFAPHRAIDQLALAKFWQKRWEDCRMSESWDRLDQQLLICLQQDNLQTADQLAAQVGRSPSAVARRLRRLRADGAIAADVSVLSETAAGRPLSAFVHLQLESHRPDDGRTLRQQLLKSPNVQLFMDVSGAFDMTLLIVAPDMAAFNTFCEATLEMPGVRRYETSFVKKKHKVTLAVPLERSR